MLRFNLPSFDGQTERDTTHAQVSRCFGETQPTFCFAAIRAAGGEPDLEKLDLYGRLADRQRRLSESIGWERVAKPPPSLQDHLKYLVEHPTPLPEVEEPATEDAEQD